MTNHSILGKEPVSAGLRVPQGCTSRIIIFYEAALKKYKMLITVNSAKQGAEGSLPGNGIFRKESSSAPSCHWGLTQEQNGAAMTLHLC